MKDEKIDFVVTWVDSEDPNWKKEKEKYCPQASDIVKSDSRSIRYRNMDLLRYWFRSIEKYAPWVNQIFFITWGHIPDWLNTDNPKLKIVKHSDYIEEKYLPTFNSNVIEEQMHKIEGLSEEFVYFNDDMFLLKPVKKSDFFKKGLPCDSMCLFPIIPKGKDGFYKKVCNDIEVINRNFSFKESFRKNRGKFLSLKQGKYWPITLSLLHYHSFIGFQNFHVPISYLKETFSEVWEKEPEILTKVLSFRFRNNVECVNHWLFQYWQFASGKFVQRKSSFGKYLNISNPKIYRIIEKQKFSMIVLNDSDKNFDFEKTEERLKHSFEVHLGEKCSFEK